MAPKRPPDESEIARAALSPASLQGASVLAQAGGDELRWLPQGGFATVGGERSGGVVGGAAPHSHNTGTAE